MSEEEVPIQEEEEVQELPPPDTTTKMYKCISKDCKAEMSLSDLESIQGIKCPYCGGRVLVKMRPKDSKRVRCD